MDKNLEILNYTRERYQEEQSRFHHFESKSGMIVSSLSIVITIYCSIISFKGSYLFSPKNEIQAYSLVLCCLSFVALIFAWFHSMLALKIGECPIPPKSKDNFNYLRSGPDDEVFTHILESYVDTTEKLSPVIDTKSYFLKLAYSELIFGSISIVGFIILIAFQEITK